MTTPPIRSARRSVTAEERRALRELLEASPPEALPEGADEEAQDEEDDEDEAEEDEPLPRRVNTRTSRRRRSRRSSHYETALIDGEAIDMLMVWTVRLGSFIMLIGSTIGSVGAFNGDVKPLLDALPFFWQAPVSQNALVTGISLQAWITGVEYWQAPPDVSLTSLLENKVYTFHLAVDIALTVLGYGAIVVPWIKNILIRVAQMPTPTAALLAYVLAGIAASFVAVLPERLLIRR